MTISQPQVNYSVVQYVLGVGTALYPHVLCCKSYILFKLLLAYCTVFKSQIVFEILLVHSVLPVSCVVLCSSAVLCRLCMYCELYLLCCTFCDALYTVNVVQELFKSGIVCLMLYIVCVSCIMFSYCMYELYILSVQDVV